MVLTEADLESIRAGSLVTKAIYLENPETATPVATKLDAPLELVVPPDRELLGEARRLGRPIAVVRFGGRTVPAEELARFAVPGTVLMPGEHGLMPAAVPPCLPLADRPFLDLEIASPRPPEEECSARTAADEGLRVGFDADGQLRGAPDPSDTVAEYTDARGYRHVVCSNRVCVCVPRFGVLRSETPFGRYDSVFAANDTRVVQGQELMKSRVPPVQAGQVEAPRAVKMRERPSGPVATVGTVVVDRTRACSRCCRRTRLTSGPARGDQAREQRSTSCARSRSPPS